MMPLARPSNCSASSTEPWQAMSGKQIVGAFHPGSAAIRSSQAWTWGWLQPALRATLCPRKASAKEAVLF